MRTMVVHFETVSKIINHYNSKKRVCHFSTYYIWNLIAQKKMYFDIHIFSSSSRLRYHTWSIKGGYRNVIHIFNSQFDRVSINIDFSEKLEIPLKKHPVCPLGRCWFKSIPVSWKRVATKSINVIVLIQGNAFSKLVLDEMMLEDINHDHKELKNLKEVFL